MIKKILVGLTDSPDATSVIRRAVELAKHHGASVTGVTLMDLERHSRVGPCGVGNSYVAAKMAARRCEEVRTRLVALSDSLAVACADAGVESRLVAAEGSPREMLRTYAASHDLVLSSLVDGKDSNRDQAVKELYALSATASSPVIAEPKVYREVKRTLIAYDGSAAARHAIELYAQTNPWPDAAIRVVNFGSDETAGMVLITEALEMLRAEGLTNLEGDFQRGKISRLDAYAEDLDADVIVVGNKGRGALMRTVVHDTARGLMKRGDRCLFMAH